MNQEIDFARLDRTAANNGPDAALVELITLLRDRNDWHGLFDARMLQKKHELGLPLSRPATLQDVPDPFRKQVEETYVSAAREAGEGFLSTGNLAEAWTYLQAIREPDKVARALDAFPDQMEDYEQLDRLVQIALYQGVNPEKGIKLMLRNHGTCSSITALDQVLPQLTPKQRANCAAIMVRSLYKELTDGVRFHIQKREPQLADNQPLESLITGRDWIFEGSAYHTDVSHLSSVVRFARGLEPDALELDLARQLALYGSKLDPKLQYGGEPPFNDFHQAHLHFFNVLLNKNREQGLQYFRDQLAKEPDERDRPLLAYALVDLLMRSDQLDEAVDIASKHLTNLGEEVGITFDELCAQAGRWDELKRIRREQKNLVGYVAALVREPVSSTKAIHANLNDK